MDLQYITNSKGEKTAVLMQISDYEKLMEDLQDLAVIAERRNDDTISHEDFLADLVRDGIIQDRVA